MKTALVALFVVLAVRPAFAHHAFAAEFDAKRPVKLQGTVTKMEWINPHAWIHIDVKKPDGTVEEWMIEAGTPNTLLRRGFTKDSLKAGRWSWWMDISRRMVRCEQTAGISRYPTEKPCFWARTEPAPPTTKNNSGTVASLPNFLYSQIGNAATVPELP